MFPLIYQILRPEHYVFLFKDVVSSCFGLSRAGFRLIGPPIGQSTTGLKLTESVSKRITKKQPLDDLYLIIILLLGTMLLVLEPPGTKQKTARVFTIDQKLWLIELRIKNPGFKRLRLPQGFQDKFGGDFLSSLTVSDWLEPDADKRVYKPDTCRTRATCAGRTEQTFPVVPKV